MKDIPAITESIDGLAGAKRSAEQQLDHAIGSLAAAHDQLVKAAMHVEKLTDGGSSSPIDQLADYVTVAREVSAEAFVALSRFRSTSNVKTNEALRSDARKGMQAKRLARWEAEALREAVVEALAGDTKP